MLRAKLNQPLGLSGLKNPLQPHARLKDLWFQLHGEAQRVSDCETSSVLPRTQLRFSREAKDKAPVSAISEAAVALLSTEKALSCEARAEAPSGANNEFTSLEGKALYSSAKALSAHIALPRGEAMTSARKSAFKAKSRAKPKTFQPIKASIQPL